jgi:putative hydrolase of the HAD superfamily
VRRPAIRYLLFDFFGTLVHYRDGVLGNPVARSLAVLEARGLHLEPRDFATRWQRIWDAIDREAAASLREVHMHEGARRFFRELDHAADDAAIATFVEHYIDDWNEGVIDIEGLHGLFASIDLDASIVSNTFYPPLVPGHVERLGLDRRFERIHTSIDHGFRKPHASIYQAALDAAGVSAPEVLFIGDNPECDYRGPRRMGMQAVLVSAQPRDGVPEHDRIAHIGDLEAWLREARDR